MSTVCVIVHGFNPVKVDQLSSEYINIPSGQDLRKIIDGFKSKWNFYHNVVGAIDETIISPNENALYYYNRNGYHSVIALVDHKCKFLDIYVG